MARQPGTSSGPESSVADPTTLQQLALQPTGPEPALDDKQSGKRRVWRAFRVSAPAAVLAVGAAYFIGTLDAETRTVATLIMLALANLLGGISIGTAVYRNNRFSDMTVPERTSVATALASLAVSFISVAMPALLPGAEGEGAIENRLAVVAALGSAFVGVAIIVATLGWRSPPVGTRATPKAEPTDNPVGND